MAIINGTAGNDNLPGTPTADIINGLGGNDQLTGRLATTSWMAVSATTTYPAARTMTPCKAAPATTLWRGMKATIR